jgi:hypothetical protein
MNSISYTCFPKLDARDDLFTSAKDCLPGCNETRYELVRAKFTKERHNENKNYAIIRVKMAEETVRKYLRDEVYSFQDILGISLLTNQDKKSSMDSNICVAVKKAAFQQSALTQGVCHSTIFESIQYFLF